MNNPLDEMREMVREGFVRYGRESYTFDSRHAALASAEGFRVQAWNEYAELGWLALRLPEAFGGLNADATMIGTLMETVGRHLLLEPIFASAVVGALAILQADADLQAEIAPRLADGTLKLAFAHGGGSAQVRAGRIGGEKTGVLHGDVADQFVVSAIDEAGELCLYLVDSASAGVSRRGYRLVDGRGAAILNFDDAPARRLGDHAALKIVLDESSVALCSEVLGSVDHLVQATAAYLKVRKQFGRVIGSYQALQHRMSEMHLQREEVRALTAAAQQALTQAEPLRSRTISGAAAYILSAARFIGNAAVQLHGGIGVTEELDISHHFRRLMVISALLGGRDAQMERFASSSFDSSFTVTHA